MSVCTGGRCEADLRQNGTESAQTRHTFAGTVCGEGGGTTPRPYWVGAVTALAGFGLAGGSTS
jgi:hypothetical protein